MHQPTFESLELTIELFGWDVVDFSRDLGPVPNSPGETMAAMWEIASRWSPPAARMCILFLARAGRIAALEAAVVVGVRTIVRLRDAERLDIGPDGLDDARLEAFAANLGRYRGQPGWDAQSQRTA